MGLSLAIWAFVLSANGALAQNQPKVEIVPLVPHDVKITSVAYSPGGERALSGSWDWTLKLWDVPTGRLIRTFDAHRGAISSVAFSPDATRVASASWDKTLKLWDARTGQEISTFAEHSDRVRSVAFSPDGRIVGASRQTSRCTPGRWR